MGLNPPGDAYYVCQNCENDFIILKSLGREFQVVDTPQFNNRLFIWIFRPCTGTNDMLLSDLSDLLGLYNLKKSAI